MATLKFKFATVEPQVLEPHTFYFLRSANSQSFVVTSAETTNPLRIGDTAALTEALTLAATKAELQATGIKVSVVLANNTDLNSLVSATGGGIFTLAGTYANSPLAGTQTGVLQIIRRAYDAGAAVNQICYTSTGQIYYRFGVFTANVWVWTGWKKFMFSDDPIVINRYDLVVNKPTGTSFNIDLAVANLFEVANDTVTSARTITFTNVPAGRGMTFIVEVVGNSNSLTFTNAVKWANETVPVPTAGRNIFTFYCNNSTSTPVFVGSMISTAL